MQLALGTHQELIGAMERTGGQFCCPGESAETAGCLSPTPGQRSPTCLHTDFSSTHHVNVLFIGFGVNTVANQLQSEVVNFAQSAGLLDISAGDARELCEVFAEAKGKEDLAILEEFVLNCHRG